MLGHPHTKKTKKIWKGNALHQSIRVYGAAAKHAARNWGKKIDRVKREESGGNRDY